MRQRSFFAGLALVAIAASAAIAQSRIYRTSSPGTSLNDNPGSRGGMTASGSSRQGGMVTNAGGAGSAAQGRSTPATQPAATPAANAQQNTRNANRPTFITIDAERERFERERELHRRDAFVPAGPIYYPVYTNPPDDTEYYTNYTSFTDQHQQQPVAEPETPAPTIFENRPGYQAPPIRAYQPTSPPASESAASQPNYTNPSADGGQRASVVDPQPTTILVFRDGHQLEIGNYAIVGDALYDMAGTNETHKILLADLDLDKTIKVNQARGYNFRLPKRQS